MLKKSYNRLLKLSDDHKQITLPDSRFYQRNGEYYPSITYVLGCYPKGPHYEDWLKKVGYSSEYLMKKAAEEGTQVHEMIEDYLNGKPISFLNPNGHPSMPMEVWQMFLRFVDFWETYNPTLIEVEVHLFSDEIKVAGTCDLVCEIETPEGVVERWVIDFKTSNHVYNTYHLQGAIYAKAYEECYGKKIDRVGILWLKSRSRGEDKKGVRLKGKNWEIVESKRTIVEDIGLFNNVKAIFDVENPNPKPKIQEFTTNVKIRKPSTPSKT